jgi:hypothetical protein
MVRSLTELIQAGEATAWWFCPNCKARIDTKLDGDIIVPVRHVCPGPSPLIYSLYLEWEEF